MFAARAFLTLACIVAPALGATYGLVDNFVGSSFLSGFQHQAIGDPTHGRVYVPPMLSPDHLMES